MSTIYLEEPLTAGGIQAINFFNGRLLSGEDLTHEQAMNLLGQRRLGKAIGTGVAFGLEVEKNATQSTASNPVLTIKRGLALNRDGQTLWVQNDTELAIVRSSESVAASGKVFSDCAPSASTVSISGDGVYLLVIAPAKEKQGKAPVSGLGNVPAACNSRYTTTGVQFRFVPLNLDPVSRSERARNEVAYQCFGLPEKQPNDFLSAALARLSQPAYGLETRVPTGRMTTHEVPLAIIQWTATGMGFVDMWAVRRRLTKAAADAFWDPLIGDRRLAEGQAMFFQFQHHSHHLAGAAADVSTIAAADHFVFLPPLGILPVRGTGSPQGFDPSQFFGAHASTDVAMLDADQLPALLDSSFRHEPVRLESVGKLQLYLIWESVRAIEAGIASQLMMVFASPSPAVTVVPRESVNAFKQVPGTSNQVFNSVFTIPAGKRLLIEYVSAKGTVPAGDEVFGIHINNPVVHFFVVSDQGTDLFGKKVFTAAQPLRATIGPFVEPTDVVVRMERKKFGQEFPAELAVTLAGQLVDP